MEGCYFCQSGETKKLIDEPYDKLEITKFKIENQSFMWVLIVNDKFYVTIYNCPKCGRDLTKIKESKNE